MRLAAPQGAGVGAARVGAGLGKMTGSSGVPGFLCPAGIRPGEQLPQKLQRLRLPRLRATATVPLVAIDMEAGNAS